MSTGFTKKTLTLSTNNAEIDGLNLVPDFSACVEKKKLNIPDEISMIQAPMI